MTFLDFFLLSETTTLQDILLNPDNDNIALDDILRVFKQHGGKVYNTGAFSTVLDHPSWNYVLKIFTDDVAYLRFVRFVLQNPRPSFPKFYDKPRKIYPRYSRPIIDEAVYYLKIEKLVPLTHKEYTDIRMAYDIRNEYDLREINRLIRKLEQDLEHIEGFSPLIKDLQYYKEIKQHLENGTIPNASKHIEQLIQDWEFLEQTVEEYPIADNTMGHFDMHNQNIMVRPNGSYVITDPVAHANHSGEHIQQKRMMTAYSSPSYKPYLPGGKKLKY